MSAIISQIAQGNKDTKQIPVLMDWGGLGEKEGKFQPTQPSPPSLHRP